MSDHLEVCAKKQHWTLGKITSCFILWFHCIKLLRHGALSYEDE